MAINTRGTELWLYDTDKTTVVKIGCPTGITGLGGERQQIEAPACLETGIVEKLAGSLTWADASISINFDPQNASHELLWDLFKEGREKVPFALGLAGSTVAPTWGSTPPIGWTLGTARDWIDFTATVRASNINIEAGSVLTAKFTLSPNDIKITKATA